MSENVLAWHFVDEKLRNGDPVPNDGELLVHDGEAVLCSSGLHASRKILDALNYAPGSTICRVRCSDVVDEEHDKFVCRRRTILWRVDARNALRAFARHEAISVAHLWDPPDVTVNWLRFGAEKDRAPARAAARAVIGDAARDAAWDAARAAAWAAAWDAAWDAAWAAAWDAAWAAANETLVAIVKESKSGVESWEWYV